MGLQKEVSIKTSGHNILCMAEIVLNCSMLSCFWMKGTIRSTNNGKLSFDVYDVAASVGM